MICVFFALPQSMKLIEAGAGYGEWLHGEAVAAGMAMAASLSARMALLAAGDAARLTDLLRRSRLPVAAPHFGAERYLALMSHDKKVVAGAIRFVLLRALGDAFVTADVPLADLRAVLAYPGSSRSPGFPGARPGLRNRATTLA